MIIIDLQQIMMANLFNELKSHTNAKVDEGMLRHMILNQLRFIRTKFHGEFGEIVIACDNKNYWRKKIFPYYKANRKAENEQSDFDWNSFYESLRKIKQELKDYFPYKVLEVETAEADDIIATLCEHFGNTKEHQIFDEKILIVSGDKDFQQLQKYTNVRQYDPVFKKKYIVCEKPEEFLKEHIIRGDLGDGIPNFLSQDDSIVTKTRQKNITKKIIDACMEMKNPSEYIKDNLPNYYNRNKALIDLSLIPEDLKEKIIEAFDNYTVNSRDGLFCFFIHHRLKRLMENLNDF